MFLFLCIRIMNIICGRTSKSSQLECNLQRPADLKQSGKCFSILYSANYPRTLLQDRIKNENEKKKRQWIKKRAIIPLKKLSNIPTRKWNSQLVTSARSSDFTKSWKWVGLPIHCRAAGRKITVDERKLIMTQRMEKK